MQHTAYTRTQNTWNHYHCSVDADILTQTATAMKDVGGLLDTLIRPHLHLPRHPHLHLLPHLHPKVGLLAAGYEYVNSDDCWMLATRDASGKP